MRIAILLLFIVLLILLFSNTKNNSGEIEESFVNGVPGAYRNTLINNPPVPLPDSTVNLALPKIEPSSKSQSCGCKNKSVCPHGTVEAKPGKIIHKTVHVKPKPPCPTTECEKKLFTCPPCKKEDMTCPPCKKEDMTCPPCPKCPPRCPDMCPDLSKYVLKTSIPPCPVQPDMSQYVLKSKMPDMSRYVLKSSIPPCNCPQCPPCKCPKCPKIPDIKVCSSMGKKQSSGKNEGSSFSDKPRKFTKNEINNLVGKKTDDIIKKHTRSKWHEDEDEDGSDNNDRNSSNNNDRNSSSRHHGRKAEGNHSGNIYNYTVVGDHDDVQYDSCGPKASNHKTQLFGKMGHGLLSNH